jgi:hypothetical protein
VLKPTQHTYSYDGIKFPAPYDDVELFEAIKRVCVIVYDIDNDIVAVSKESKYEHIQ